MFVRQCVVTRIDGMDLLDITADVPPHIPRDLRFHFLLGMVKPRTQPEFISACLESDQLAMNRPPTELQPLAERVHEDLAAKAAKRSIRLDTDIPDGLMLDADGDRLQQAVFNLVDNAIKYGRPEGSVTIEAHPNGNGMAEVAVVDDGHGIPAESVEKVFERFFRVDKARSRESGGTGLGLAIVKHIAQAHGGQVRLERREGKGSRFVLSIPLVKHVE